MKGQVENHDGAAAIHRRGAVILHCFYEKEGKEVTGYEKHAPIAMERKREMEV